MLSSVSRSMRWAFLLMDMTDSRTSMEPWSFPLAIWSGGLVGDRTGLRFPEAQSHHLLEATQDSQAKHRKSYMKGLIHHLVYTEPYAVPNFGQV